MMPFVFEYVIYHPNVTVPRFEFFVRFNKPIVRATRNRTKRS